MPFHPGKAFFYLSFRISTLKIFLRELQCASNSMYFMFDKICQWIKFVE